LDASEAVKWYRLAADQGNADAQFNLGKMYSKGRGVPLDKSEGVKWYRLAADQGNAEAQYSLGAVYDGGEGEPQNFIIAHMWYNLAFTNGVGFAANSRDELAAKMAPEDVSKAQEMATACMNSDYENCGG
jgi:hypothetical protein